MKSTLKLLKNKLNRITSFWCSDFSLATLKLYRIFEIQQVSKQVSFDKKKILEIGSGFGWQSNYLMHGWCSSTASDIVVRDMRLSYLPTQKQNTQETGNTPINICLSMRVKGQNDKTKTTN